VIQRDLGLDGSIEFEDQLADPGLGGIEGRGKLEYSNFGC
jgi:hypothetical protein